MTAIQSDKRVVILTELQMFKVSLERQHFWMDSVLPYESRFLLSLLVQGCGFEALIVAV